MIIFNLKFLHILNLQNDFLEPKKIVDFCSVEPLACSRCSSSGVDERREKTGRVVSE